ncbi:hypothetical protein MMC18_004949 [Xylographa bjoerkii]|nr:hypothetical protein [Xylographa bjoerkii]
MPMSVSRISPAAFEAGLLAFLIVALLTTTARTAIRWQTKHKFYTDDAFLGLAVASFSASWAMVWYSQPTMWQQQQALAELELGGPTTIDIEQSHHCAFWTIRVRGQVFIPLSLPPSDPQCWTFEKLVVGRSYQLRGVYGCTGSCLLGLVWNMVTNMAKFVKNEAYEQMPLADLRSATCPDLQEHARIELAVGSTLDILTDFMVISVPVFLLWRIKINLRQKLYIVAMLSLSGIIILIVVIRVALTALPSGIMDGPWIAFWQIAEPSIAIIMVSINAFRHPFVSRIVSRSGGRKRQPHSSSSGVRPQGDYDPKGDYIDLPTLPPSTIGRSPAPIRHKPVVVEEIEMILPMYGARMEVIPRGNLSFR